MAELEQQIAEHNILQKEIEAYGQQLRNLIGPVRDVQPHLALKPSPDLPHQSRCGPSGPRDAGRGEAGEGVWAAISPVPRLSLSLLCAPPPPTGRGRTQLPSGANTWTSW